MPRHTSPHLLVKREVPRTKLVSPSLPVFPGPSVTGCRLLRHWEEAEVGVGSRGGGWAAEVGVLQHFKGVLSFLIQEVLF